MSVPGLSLDQGGSRGARHASTVAITLSFNLRVVRAQLRVAEGRDPGDLTTIEDPAALEQIRGALNP